MEPIEVENREEHRGAELRSQVILMIFTLRLMKSQKMKHGKLDYARSPRRIRLSRETRTHYRELAGPEAFAPKEWTFSKWDRTVYHRIVTAYHTLLDSPRDSIIRRMFDRGYLVWPGPNPATN